MAIRICNNIIIPNLSGDTVCQNTALGISALANNTTGCSNLAVGYNALSSNTYGNCNVSVGNFALANNTTGNRNIAVGCSALVGNISGCNNIAISVNALQINTSGSNSIAIGINALTNANSIGNNTGIGYSAGSSITSGIGNVIIGGTATSELATSSCNVVIADGCGNVKMSFNNTGALSFGRSYTNFGTAGCSLVYAFNCGWCSGSIPTGAKGASGATASLSSSTTLGSVYAWTTSTTYGNIHFGGGGGCAGCIPPLPCNNSISINCGCTGGIWLDNVGNNFFHGNFGPTNGTNNIVVGCLAFINNTCGSCNIALGDYALQNNTIGCNNISVATGSFGLGTDTCHAVAVGPGIYVNGPNGYGASISARGGLNYNIGISGNYGGYCMTTGSFNTYIGSCALFSNTSGSNNTGIGPSAGSNNTFGSGNISIGYRANGCTTLGGGLGAHYHNIVIGCNSLICNSLGNCNIAIGGCTLCSNTTGCNNIALGLGALYQNKTGYNNIALGQFAGAGSCFNGHDNIGIGYRALFGYGVPANSQCYNVAVGYCALYCSVTGSNNIALGAYSLSLNRTGNNNIAVGYGAMYCGCGNFNVALGLCALNQNLTGANNVAIGCLALYRNTTAARNIGIGWAAIGVNCLGSGNIAVGYLALNTPIQTDNNVAIGAYSMYFHYNCTANNVAVGVCSLYSSGVSSFCGCYNVAIGTSSLNSVNGISNANTAIGHCTGQLINTQCMCNMTLLGYCAWWCSLSASNSITLGNTGVACIRAQVSTITAFSDCRDKTNICSIPVGLEFVRALRPVKFEWNQRNAPNDGKKGMTEPGFIAQELDEVVKKFNAEWMRLVSKDNPDRLEATIGRLLPVLTRAVQELADEGDQLQAEIDLLQSQLT